MTQDLTIVLPEFLLALYALGALMAAVYTVKDGKIIGVPDSGGISPVDFSMTKAEHAYGESWLRNILTEMST